MKRDEMLPSKFLKWQDLKGSERKVTIKDVVEEEVGMEKEKEFVMSFVDKDKKMIMNSTNKNALFDVWEDSDDWVGKEIILFAVETSFGGKACKGLRVRVIEQKQERTEQPVMSDGDERF